MGAGGPSLEKAKHHRIMRKRESRNPMRGHAGVWFTIVSDEAMTMDLPSLCFPNTSWSPRRGLVPWLLCRGKEERPGHADYSRKVSVVWEVPWKGGWWAKGRAVWMPDIPLDMCIPNIQGEAIMETTIHSYIPPSLFSAANDYHPYDQLKTKNESQISSSSKSSFYQPLSVGHANQVTTIRP